MEAQAQVALMEAMGHLVAQAVREAQVHQEVAVLQDLQVSQEALGLPASQGLMERVERRAVVVVLVLVDHQEQVE